MLALLIPILATRLYEFLKTKTVPQNTFLELRILSTAVIAFHYFKCPLEFAIPLWTTLSLFLFFQWYASYKFQTPISITAFLRHPRSFLDSLKEIQAYKICFTGICLIGVSLLGFLSAPILFFWIFSWGISWIDIGLNFQTSSSIKKHKISFSFPNEWNIPVSPKYPALRKTLGFKGKRKIPLSLQENEKPHIIFLFLESFRAKNVGCLGAKIPASPFFDLWAEKGILFQNFYANGPQTFRTILSSFFGIPAHLPTATLKPFCSLPLVGLPQILKKEGYHPAIIQSGDISFDFLYPFFQKHGFETILGAENMKVKEERFNSWGLKDETTMRFAAEWLEKQKKPAFLSLFTINNHHPWKAPKEWNFPLPEGLSPLYQNYLQTFSYTDYCLNVFLQELKQKNLLEKTILFITGDHGQDMRERGSSEFHPGLFQENIHVPLLLLALGRNLKPARFDIPASFLDFLPTILDLLDLQAIHHSLGKSLLRNADSAVYFSAMKKSKEIGAVEGRKKVILSSNQILGFDLDQDPLERESIGNSLKDLGDKCQSFFHSIEKMYQSSSWAPSSHAKTPLEIQIQSHMDDSEWLSYLANHDPIPIINLSSSCRISDKAILEVSPFHARCWHRVNFSNSPGISDRSLDWLGKHCPNLMAIDLSYCHLITNKGVEKLLTECRQLRYLELNGLFDLSDFVPKDITFLFHLISLKCASNLSGNSLVQIFTHSPSLVHWSADLQQLSDVHLLEMSREKKECTRMYLSKGDKIHDRALTSLIEAQEELIEIHIDDFPKIESPDFSHLKNLRHLFLSDCPHLGDELFDTLGNISTLSYLRLENCPKITEKGLEKLSRNRKIHIFLGNCPKIDKDAILSLRKNGSLIF